jgi:fused-like protein
MSMQVYKGRRQATGQITAMKFIGKHGKTAREIRSLRQEIEILRGLKHENIVQMLDTFETQNEFCVVMEFAQGTLAYVPSQHQTGIWGVIGFFLMYRGVNGSRIACQVGLYHCL